MNLKQPLLKPDPYCDLYHLQEDYILNLDDNQKIVVPKHFRFDGASIPKIAWQLTFSPFQPDVMVPALIHDWLYCNHQFNQKKADYIFYELLIINGVNPWKARMMWLAVRVFGQLERRRDAELQLLLDVCIKNRNSPNFKHYKFPQSIVNTVDSSK